MSVREATGSLSDRRPVARLNRPLADGYDRIGATRIRKASSERRYQRRIGLLGGSFNPAHEGHRAISLDAIRHLDLHQVWWLVSPQNPLKSRNDMATLSARMASASAVAAGHPRLVVMDLEQKIGTQYTVDTVKWLTRNEKNDFVWLIGADNLMQLPKWQSWQTLLDLVPIAVFDREPYSYKALAGRIAHAYADCRMDVRHAADLVKAGPPAWVYFRLRRHRISSTAIRSRRTWPVQKRY